MLDDPRNDIFIHMDSKNQSYNEDEITRYVGNSNVYHTQRTSVTWGGYSQINSELLLIKKAVNTGKYQHYHLLSGADLPIKTQDEIVRFFEENEGKEFIRFEKADFVYTDRTQYFYPFQEIAGRTKSRRWRLIYRMSLFIQKSIGIKRNQDISFQKGTNWFSITDSLARYVAGKEEWIKSVFQYTFCCDEVFLQTIVFNSDFRNHLFHSGFDNDLHAIMRLIDWKRGFPYIFKQCDWSEIKESEMMFARKFDENVDREIILRISNEFIKK